MIKSIQRIKKLVHISSGSGYPVLEFYKALSPLFSKNFLADPGDEIVKTFNDNQEINWVLGLKHAKQVTNFNEEIKELLHKGRKKNS